MGVTQKRLCQRPQAIPRRTSEPGLCNFPFLGGCLLGSLVSERHGEGCPAYNFVPIVLISARRYASFAETGEPEFRCSFLAIGVVDRVSGKFARGKANRNAHETRGD